MPAGFDLVSHVVVTYLEIAAAHLGGMATLYRAGEVTFPPLPVARSVIEHSSRVLWVLGDAPAGYADMLARAYLETFDSAQYAKATAGQLGSKQDANHEAAKRRWKTIRSRAIAAFPGTTAEDLSEGPRGRTLGGQVFRGPTDGVKWMFKLLADRAGGSVTVEQALGAYGLLSSGTHPSLELVRRLRIPVDHGDHLGFDLRADTVLLEWFLTVALVPFYNALSYVIGFYDADRAPPRSTDHGDRNRSA